MASKNPLPRKQGMSAAFHEKAKKERDALQSVLGTQLEGDMIRMFKEGEFANITMTSGVDRTPVHLPLVHTRLPDLFALCNKISGLQIGTEEHQEFDIGKVGVSPDDAKDLLRLLYASNDIKPHWKDIRKSSSIKSHSIQAENTVVNNQESCQADNTEPLNKANQNHQITTPLEEEALEEEDETRTTNEPSETIKWRKTDPKFNDPGIDETNHLQNGDLSEGDAGGDSSSSEPTKAVVNNTDMVESLTEGPIVPDVDVKNLPKPAHPLGRDLLNMFVSGCGHDVKIKVEDKEIPAHKFVLCTRSNYFAAMFGGSWRESSSAESYIEGVSYQAVLFTLYFIYGATVDLPDGVDVREIVYLADMYCLEGLKRVAAFKLRHDNCHFFHKPCSGCLSGIAEAIMLSDSYRMTELYESSVRWIVKYLDRTWSHRSFASMPSELIHQCSEFAVTELTPDTAVTMVTLVDKLVQSLPHVKWADPVHKEARWLLDACIQYVASNFLDVSKEKNFETLLVGLGWNKDLLEPLFTRVVHSLSVEIANPTYVAVNTLRQRASLADWNQDALELVNQLLEMCHNYMVSNVNYLVHAQGWQRIPQELRSKIKEDAVFVDDTKKVLAPRPVLSSSQRSRSQLSARGASGSSSQSTARNASRSAGGQRSASRTQVKNTKSASSKSKP